MGDELVWQRKACAFARLSGAHVSCMPREIALASFSLSSG